MRQMKKIANQTRRGALVGQGRGGVIACRTVVIDQDRVLTRKLEKKKKRCCRFEVITVLAFFLFADTNL